jgi:hypothetical protein
MKRGLLVLLCFISLSISAAQSYPVGWVRVLGFIEGPEPKIPQDFYRLLTRYWQYSITVNYIPNGVEIDLQRPEFSQRSVRSCRELITLGNSGTLYHGKKGVLEQISQSEVARYLQTCKAYRRTMDMKPSKYKSEISAKQLAEYLINHYIAAGGNFLDAMIGSNKITAVDNTHCLVLVNSGSIYIIRKISWGDYDQDGYEDIHFVIVLTQGKHGEAQGMTVGRLRNGKISIKERW